jgi:hypothetical protein
MGFPRAEEDRFGDPSARSLFAGAAELARATRSVICLLSPAASPV